MAVVGGGSSSSSFANVLAKAVSVAGTNMLVMLSTKCCFSGAGANVNACWYWHNFYFGVR